MLFTDIIFAPFLLLTFAAFACAARVPRAQRIVLLMASYVFYGWWDVRFLALIGFSTGLDFFAGRQIAAAGDGPGRRRWLAVSLVGNLGMLGLFKYLGFFTESLRSSLAALGIDAPLPHLDLLLPIGISFYTFQTLSYSLDIYFGRLRPTDSLLDFMLYVAAFPQLVAGPIVRARTFLPQLAGNLFSQSSSAGLVFMAYGLTKKLVLADPIGSLFVDPVFAAHGAASAGELGLAAVLYSFQIFLDFSAYSDIALGLGLVFGLQLPVNFRSPFMAANPREFWERWHITLSTWLRDYLYVPLGGNRGSRSQLYRNLMIVMLLGGLWHGANWTFVVWGAIHGVALCVHRAWSMAHPRPPAHGLRRLPSMAACFTMVCLAFVFFRAPDMETALGFLDGLFSLRAGAFDIASGVWMLALACPVVHFLCEPRLEGVAERFARLPAVIQGSLAAGFLVFLRSVDQLPGGGDAFIYFQF